MKTKRDIIKDAIKKAPKSPSPMTSRANRGIYRTGPWSDGLTTTNVKVDGAGGPGITVPEIKKNAILRGSQINQERSVEEIKKKPNK